MIPDFGFFSTEVSCLHSISIMHISNLLIAVIVTAAIAKPLPDAQTGSPFGYFPSDFGDEGELYTSQIPRVKRGGGGSRVLLWRGVEGGIPSSLLFLRSFRHLSTELYNSFKQWGAPVINRPDGGNTLPDGNNPSANSNGPQIGNPTPVEDVHDGGNPSLVPNGPAERDPKSYHTTTEHPPGISPAFKYFREFWCGAFEGRGQSVCCLGNGYGPFRPFTGELMCEKSMLLPPFPNTPYPITMYCTIQSLKFADLTLVFSVEQWVLGAGTETIAMLDNRFLRYCHKPSYFYSCDDYYVRISPLPRSPLPSSRLNERIHNPLPTFPPAIS